MTRAVVVARERRDDLWNELEHLRAENQRLVELLFLSTSVDTLAVAE